MKCPLYYPTRQISVAARSKIRDIGAQINASQSCSYLNHESNYLQANPDYSRVVGAKQALDIVYDLVAETGLTAANEVCAGATGRPAWRAAIWQGNITAIEVEHWPPLMRGAAF